MSAWQNPPLAHRMLFVTEACPAGYVVLRYGDSVGVQRDGTQLGFVVDRSDDWDGSDMAAVLADPDRTPLGPCLHWMEGVEMIIRHHENTEATR